MIQGRRILPDRVSVLVGPTCILLGHTRNRHHCGQLDEQAVGLGRRPGAGQRLWQPQRLYRWSSSFWRPQFCCRCCYCCSRSPSTRSGQSVRRTSDPPWDTCSSGRLAWKERKNLIRSRTKNEIIFCNVVTGQLVCKRQYFKQRNSLRKKLQ